MNSKIWQEAGYRYSAGSQYALKLDALEWDDNYEIVRVGEPVPPNVEWFSVLKSQPGWRDGEGQAWPTRQSSSAIFRVLKPGLEKISKDKITHD